MGGTTDLIYEDVVSASGLGAWSWHVDRHVMVLSPGWLAMLGFEENDLPFVPESWFARVHTDDMGALSQAIDQHLRGLSSRLNCDYRIKDANGYYHWMAAVGQLTRDAESGEQVLSGLQIDMTERKRLEEQLSHHALHDGLTHLPNRTLFQERLLQAFLRVRRDQTKGFSLFFLDLDHFKAVNDSLGHGAGDQLLIAIVPRLLAACRECDTVARLSGDEFTILLPDMVEVADVESWAKRLLKEVEKPITIDGHQLYPSVSIGIAICDGTYDRPDELMHSADLALYAVKQKGKGGFLIHTRDDHPPEPFAFRLYGGLDQALKNHEMSLYYQSFVHLKTGAPAGVEGLLRWDHPRLGLLLPDAFLSHAIDNRFIIQLGQFTLRESLRQWRRWRTAYPDFMDTFILSINMTVIELCLSSFVDNFFALLKSNKIKPHQVMIDLSPFGPDDDPGTLVAVCTTLRDRGVLLALDRFGAREPSLMPLASLPLTHLKFDPLWTTRVADSAKVRDLIRMTVGACGVRGVTPMATGIETADQLNALIDLGITLGQGHFFEPPLPLADWDASVRVAADRG